MYHILTDTLSKIISKTPHAGLCGVARLAGGVQRHSAVEMMRIRLEAQEETDVTQKSHRIADQKVMFVAR